MDKSQLLNSADQAADKKDYAQACIFYTNYLKTNDDNEIKYKLAVCFYHLNQYNRATSVLIKVTAVKEISIKLYSDSILLLGFCYKKVKDWKNALKTFRIFNKKFPADSRNLTVISVIGLMYEELEDFKNAVLTYTYMLEKYKNLLNKEEIFFNLLRCYAKLKDEKNSQKYYDQVVSNTKDKILIDHSMFQMGHLYMTMNKISRAITIFEELTVSSTEKDFINSIRMCLNECKLKIKNNNKIIDSYQGV